MNKFFATLSLGVISQVEAVMRFDYPAFEAGFNANRDDLDDAQIEGLFGDMTA